MSSDDTDILVVPTGAGYGGPLPAELLEAYARYAGHGGGRRQHKRTAITRDMLNHLRIVRDTFAPLGRFKNWCVALGWNYEAISHLFTGRDCAEQASLVQSYAESLPELLRDRASSRLATYRHFAAESPELLLPVPPDELDAHADWY